MASKVQGDEPEGCRSNQVKLNEGEDSHRDVSERDYVE